MTSPVLSPDYGTYTTRSAYLTPTEYLNAATGVDSSNLVPGGSPSQQTAALGRVIARASAWADNLTYKVLAATIDTQAGRYLSRDGVISVPVKYSPLIAVTGISVGADPWSVAPLASLAQVGIEPPALVRFADPGAGWGRGASGLRRFVTVTYVNGWANTTLAAGAPAAATTVTVATALGIGPGQALTLADGGNTEQITVAASFTPTAAPGPATVPLTAPLAYGHATGAGLTAFPESIKEAVILLTSALIKTRGSEAFEMPGIGSQPSKMDHAESGGIEEVDVAIDLLEPFRRAR